VSAPAVQLALPAAVVSRADMTRLVRELETVDNELGQQKARHQGESGRYHLPTMSQALTDFLTSNKIDISNDHARMDIKAQLRKLKDHAPVMHMTFATEVDPESMQYIAAWIRHELHPQALISVGLQPSLIAGVYVRTPNHVHDLSIRASMKDSRKLIVEALDKLKEPAQ
jgi:G3E family GTPase